MKYAVKIGLHSGIKPNSGEVPIRLRVTWSGCRADVRSGIVIAPAKWDAAKCCVVPGVKNSYRQTSGEINRALVALTSTVEEVLSGYEAANGCAPSVSEFKRLFDAATGRAKEDTSDDEALGFFEVFDLFTSEMGATNNWTKATRQKFATIKRHLYDFNPSLSLATFSKNDFAAWSEYLQNVAGLLNTTVSKDIGFVRWFLRWAVANGHYDGKAHLQLNLVFAASAATRLFISGGMSCRGSSALISAKTRGWWRCAMCSASAALPACATQMPLSCAALTSNSMPRLPIWRSLPKKRMTGCTSS